MTPSEKLLEFFRSEFRAEERSGFKKLSRVPNTSVRDLLAYYVALNASEQADYIDCGAHWAHARYGFVVGAPEIDHTKHPYFRQWSHALVTYRNETHWAHSQRSVPSLRAMVQQSKIDRIRGIQSGVAVEDYEHASSIRSVKAPELRKRVRSALRPLGYYRKDKLGYCCRRDGREFRADVSFGGARTHHQLLYGVMHPEFDKRPVFAFELALGFVLGNRWDFVVEENVDDALLLFADLVNYSFSLPERVRAAVA
jgi:hypothetical protein